MKNQESFVSNFLNPDNPFFIVNEENIIINDECKGFNTLVNIVTKEVLELSFVEGITRVDEGKYIVHSSDVDDYYSCGVLSIKDFTYREIEVESAPSGHCFCTYEVVSVDSGRCEMEVTHAAGQVYKFIIDSVKKEFDCKLVDHDFGWLPLQVSAFMNFESPFDELIKGEDKRFVSSKGEFVLKQDEGVIWVEM